MYIHLECFARGSLFNATRVYFPDKSVCRYFLTLHTRSNISRKRPFHISKTNFRYIGQYSNRLLAVYGKDFWSIII